MKEKNTNNPQPGDTPHGDRRLPGGLLLDLCKVERRVALRTWLIFHGITEKEIGRKLNISPSTVTRLLSGERRNSELLGRLAEMGIPPVLLTGED